MAAKVKVGEFFLEVLRTEVEKIVSYPKIVCATMPLETCPTLTYWQAAQILAAQGDGFYRAVGLWASARCIDPQDESKMRHNGLTELELYVEALKCNPDYYLPYYSLGSVLSAGTSITLSDGRTLSNRELLIESNRLNPEFTFVYCNLAISLDPSETNNLGTCLLPTEKICLHDGRTFTRRELYVAAIGQNRSCRNAYFNLGLSLDNGETLELLDKRCLTKRQFFMEALRCDPDYGAAKAKLRALTSPGEGWARRSHRMLFGCRTNTLFATLLLGVQRLEETGLLPLAHQAMLEDMLEFWTFGDDGP